MVESIACYTVGGLLLNLSIAYSTPILAVLGGCTFALGVWIHG